MPSVRLRLALLLLALSATPALAATVDAASAAAAAAADANAALTQALTDSIALSQRGDTVGALMGFERVFADPRAAQLPAPVRVEGLISAGRTAFNARQPVDARRYLDAALQQAPDDPRAWYVLGRLLLWQQQPLPGAEAITRALQGSDQFLPEIDYRLAFSLREKLQDHPDALRAFLQVLFDRGWTDDGLEPGTLWLQLATLQADAGEHPRLAATIARIDSPMEIVALRSDKRFDQVVDRRSPRFDPAQSAQRHLDALRVSGLLKHDRGDRIIALSETLLFLGEHAQVLGTTDELYARLNAPGSQRSFPGAQYAAWLMQYRAMAEHRLGRDADTTATLILAAQLDENGPVNAFQRASLASWYLARQQPADALQALDGLDEAPMFGEAMRQWVRYVAYRDQADPARSALARQWLQTNQGIGREIWIAVLLEENRMDAAAAWLIAQLQSPNDRQAALLLIQGFRMLPPLPGDAARDKRGDQLLQRRDVQRAVNAVGRIEVQPIHGRAAWR